VGVAVAVEVGVAVGSGVAVDVGVDVVNNSFNTWGLKVHAERQIMRRKMRIRRRFL
jgi:hypothetical protein